MKIKKQKKSEDLLCGEDIALEEYKLFVETTTQVSNQRLRTNSFFLSIITALITAFGFLVKNPPETIQYEITLAIIAIFGVLLNIIWILNIRSYKRLNAAKFASLNKIEKQLPFKPFHNEWKELQKTQGFEKYFTLTRVESFLPLVLMLLFIVLLLFSI